MKKIIYLLGAVIALTASVSCKNEVEDTFGASAAIRMERALDQYTQDLKSAKGGWVMEYYPTSDQKPELIAMRFNADGTCTMGMKTPESLDLYLTDNSLWQMIADNGPVLSFNSYNNCLHAYATPDPSWQSGMEDGYGYMGDYEFMVIKVDLDADTIMLKGKKRGTYNRLTRLPDDVNFEKYLVDVDSFDIDHFTTRNYALLHFGDKKYRMDYGELRQNTSTGKEEVTYFQRQPDIYPIDSLKGANARRYAYSTIKQPNGEYRLRFNTEVFNQDSTMKARNFLFSEKENAFLCQEDASIKITGPIPYDLFNSTLQTGTFTIAVTDTLGTSSDIRAAYQKMSDAFKSVKYTLSNLNFSLATDDTGKRVLQCSLSYRSTKASTVLYYFALDKNEYGKMKFTFLPEMGTGGTLMNNVPSIREFMELISKSYTMSTAPGGFIVTNYRLTAENNPNQFMTVAFR